MNDRLIKTFDEGLILEKYFGLFNSTSSCISDPFEPFAFLAQAAIATKTANLAEVTSAR